MDSTYIFLQHYWWFLVSLLGALLVFLLFVQGGNSLLYCLGRVLWAIILIKLFVMFFVLKLFFFPSFLKGKTETEKQDYVGLELTNRMAE